MIVCQCRVVNDTALARAVDQGAETVGQVCRLTGAGQDCGTCVFTIKAFVCEYQRTDVQSYAEVRESAAG